MNERIRELAEQAESLVSWGDPNNRDDHNRALDEWLEKFAKLIVRECIEIVEPCKCGCRDGEPESLIANNIIKQIKQHFGVEE